MKVYVALLLSFLFLTTAFADDFGDSTNSIQCGNRWANVGMTKAQVWKTCGKPTKIYNWQTHYFIKDPYNPNVSQEVTTNYSRWTYNRGSASFVMYLNFQGNALQTIGNGGYGS